MKPIEFPVMNVRMLPLDFSRTKVWPHQQIKVWVATIRPHDAHAHPPFP